MTHDLLLMHLNFIVKPLGHTFFDVQETQKVILSENHDFLPLFSEEGLWSPLLKQSGIDHKITLQSDFYPPFGLLYRLSQAELKA
jgi:hypothetical protein